MAAEGRSRAAGPARQALCACPRAAPAMCPLSCALPFKLAEPILLERHYGMRLLKVMSVKKYGSSLPHMRFHDLRHYFASVCLKLKKYAMDLMSHFTPGMLKRYHHILENERKATQGTVINYWNSSRTGADN